VPPAKGVKIVRASRFARQNFLTAAFALAAAPAFAQQAAPAAPQFEPPGAEPAWAKTRPLTLSLSYASDLNADVAGGRQRGAAYLGKASLVLDADLDRLIGLRGAIGHISILEIHGVGLSADYVGNLAPVSGIEAEPALRLNQVWLQIPVGQARNVAVRFGKFPAAQEFMASPTAALFISSTFGWPGSFASDLPSGGPSWPLSAPGALVTSRIGGRVTAKVAAFAGDPAGHGQADPQHRDGHGFNSFGFAGRPFVIAETAYATGAATFTIGGWVFQSLRGRARALRIRRARAFAQPGGLRDDRRNHLEGEPNGRAHAKRIRPYFDQPFRSQSGRCLSRRRNKLEGSVSRARERCVRPRHCTSPYIAAAARHRGPGEDAGAYARILTRIRNPHRSDL
jgi:Carbohydrate-selective porin, OprB family